MYVCTYNHTFYSNWYPNALNKRAILEAVRNGDGASGKENILKLNHGLL